tara:strand:- start:5 stop:295 length:291 start_codon:yes stop_codon:yes gene_type:complete
MISRGYRITEFRDKWKTIYSKTFFNKYIPIHEDVWVDDKEFIKAMKKPDGERYIWTIGEEDGNYYVHSGYHWVNRLGFIITKNKWEHDMNIQVLGY